MKVVCKQKYNEFIDDCLIEVSIKVNDIVIKENYYGFTERQAKKKFKAYLKKNKKLRLGEYDRHR